MAFQFQFDPARAAGLPGGLSASPVYRQVACCDDEAGDAPGATAEAGSEPRGRTKLHQLHAHLHCSIIGTCLSTAELRKIVDKLGTIDAARASDLEIHHEGVTIAHDAVGGKAITKALDKRHDASLQAFAKAKDADALTSLWQQALQSGAIPGAYWALMSHRHVTPELRQRAFGEVHMLSHLVGAANRADIRRLALLEAENAERREQAERQQERIAELLEQLQSHRSRQDNALVLPVATPTPDAAQAAARIAALEADLAAQVDLVALQTQRREAAEQALSASEQRLEDLGAELDLSKRLAETMARELHAAESHLQANASTDDASIDALRDAIAGRRILYVGGRPSSTPAIRKLVSESGGELIHHDGGMEDRKGMLAAALAGVQLAVFPVDCVDHDSVGNLKKLCGRHGIPFVALRTASVTCFAAAMVATNAASVPSKPAFRMCLKHG